MKEITLFIPCLLNHLLPDTGFKLVKVIEKLGYKVLLNDKQTCCGYPFIQSGDKEEAKQVAEKFLFDFQTGRHDHFTLIPAPRCFFAINNQMPKIFLNSVSHNLCQKVVDNSKELYAVLLSHNISVIPQQKCLLIPDCVGNKKTIHALTLPYSDNWETVSQLDYCCGGGCSFPTDDLNRVVKNIDIIIKEAEDKQCKKLVFTDELCLMYVSQYLKLNNKSLSVAHLIDVIHDSVIQPQAV